MLRKRKPKLNSFTNKNKLLHSKNSKSTYFYKQWSSWTSACHNIFASGFRLRDGANPTRSSLAFKNPYSKNAYGRLGLNKSYILPVACSLALFLVAGFAINPFAQGEEEVYAEEGISAYAGTPEPDTNTTGMSVSLTMADPDQTLLQQNAKAGEMSYISSGFTVKTENVDGYNVYVQTAPGSTNKLTNGNISIDFVTTETPVSNFTDNTWGYAVDDTGTTVENLKYNPVPDTASIMNPAYTSSSTGETRSFTLNFATKFAKDATPGHYTSGVLLSVAAGAGEVTELGFGKTARITKMQEMTSAICNGAGIGDEGVLIDSRDNNTYWVARLNDGRCWMTQNLNLDIPEEGLNSADTDILEDWNSVTNLKYPPVKTQTEITPDFTNNTNDPNMVMSWDPEASNGKRYCSDNATDKCGLTVSRNGGHDAQGNYYTFNAATAGKGYTKDNGTIEDSSICPKGWSLPNSAEFRALLEDLTPKQAIDEMYSYAFGGLIQTGGNVLSSAGQMGYYWKSDAGTDTLAYNISLGSSAIQLAGAASRNIGTSIRCVAR